MPQPGRALYGKVRRRLNFLNTQRLSEHAEWHKKTSTVFGRNSFRKNMGRELSVAGGAMSKKMDGSEI